MRSHTEIAKSPIFEIGEVEGVFYRIIRMDATGIYHVKEYRSGKNTNRGFTKNKDKAFEIYGDCVADAAKIATAVIPW